MELKLKDDNNSNDKPVNKNSYESAYNTQDSDTPKPVVIKFDEVPPPVQSRKNSHVEIIIKILVFIFLAVAAFLIYSKLIKPHFTTTDVTDYVKSDEATIGSKLKLSGEFEQDNAWRDRMPVYSNMRNGMTVKSNDGIGIIYKNDKQIGIAVDGKEYKIFGVKIGDPEYKVSDNITFTYDNEFNIFDDLVDTRSMGTYYHNFTTNELLVITVNGNTNRVVAITYFYDGRFLTNTLQDITE